MKRLALLLFVLPLWIAGALPTPALRFLHANAPAPDLSATESRTRWQMLTAAGHPFLVRADYGLVLPAKKQPLAHGVKWLAPVPPDGWIVLPLSAQESPPPFVRWCGSLPPEAKRGPGLDARAPPPALRVRRTDQKTVLMESREPDQLTRLLRDPDVWAVDGARPRLRPANDVVRLTTGADFAQAAPWNLDGGGVALAIWDEGDIEHPDFGDRLTIVRHADVSEHSTHVAGTMAGDGSLSPGRRLRGVAPAATIYAWNFSDPPSDIEAGRAAGAFWANNSWVYLISNDQGNCAYLNTYDELTAAYDEAIAFGEPTFGFAFAAGNMGAADDCDISARSGYSSLPPPATAKNIIAVGSTDDGRDVSYFSSRGPTADGRVKPDVTALGCENPGKGYVESTLPPDQYGGSGWCGTSMATPQVTAAAALLKQLADRLTVPLRSSLLKALLIAGAHDINAPGPSFKDGWGQIDLVASAALLQYNGFAEGALATADDIVEFQTEVPTGTPALEITLVWDDPPPAETAAQTLVNDLELRLVGPDENEASPWVLDPENPDDAATRGEDHRNNVEQVRVDQPAAGMWTVRVSAASLQTEQPFSLAGWALGDLSCDADGDRSPGPQCDGNDCNDHDPSIRPNAAEICYDETDQDCDGVADEGCEEDTPIIPDESPTPQHERDEESRNGCGCG
jgi:hypothetical protein